MWKSPLWIVGMFLSVFVNATLTLVAFFFASATVVTSFAGVHIMFNMIIAKSWGGESTACWDYVGSACVVAGIILVVWFAGKELAVSSVELFFESVGSIGGILFFSISGAIILLALMLAIDKLAKLMEVNCIRIAAVFERLILSTAPGVCGGCSNISGKALTVVVGQMIPTKGWVLLQWQSIAILCMTGLFAVLQLILLNVGLKKFDAIYVVPVINSVLIAAGSIGGIVVFKEIPIEAGFFTLGLVLVVGGVVALSYGKYDSEKDVNGAEGAGDALIQQQGDTEPLVETRGAAPTEGSSPARKGCLEVICAPLVDATIKSLAVENVVVSRHPSFARSRSIRTSQASLSRRHTYEPGAVPGGSEELPPHTGGAAASSSSPAPVAGAGDAKPLRPASSAERSGGKDASKGTELTESSALKGGGKKGDAQSNSKPASGGYTTDYTTSGGPQSAQGSTSNDTSSVENPNSGNTDIP
eukprot:GHVU01176176.1.p1 GENE.GHVU01176176.1~~GHVU01176176.1.p1  ORF type:complete len:496 (+),score=49.78 GHVU01176176.1:74-1489(+)